jgi:predicted site-specific integrase-resolvase
MSNLLTRKEAAEMLGLKPHTLCVWSQTGKNLKVIKNGTYIRYRKEDIEEYLQNHLCNASRNTKRNSGDD